MEEFVYPTYVHHVNKRAYEFRNQEPHPENHAESTEKRHSPLPYEYQQKSSKLNSGSHQVQTQTTHPLAMY